MKTAGIRRFLESIGVSENTESRIRDLRSINLRSNGNHYIDFRTDAITFDTDNGLVKIKEYDCAPISGLLRGYEKLSDGYCSYITTSTLYGHTFRKPKVGDILLKINRSTLAYSVVGTVNYVDISSIKCDATEEVSESSYWLAYVDSAHFADSSRDLGDSKIFVRYTPRTSYDADVYICFYSIVGFTAASPVLG